VGTREAGFRHQHSEKPLGQQKVKATGRKGCMIQIAFFHSFYFLTTLQVAMLSLKKNKLQLEQDMH
jgi:hypothetical protein